GLGVPAGGVAGGARVGVTARKPDGVEEAVRRLGADRVIGVPGRADDPERQAAAVARALEEFGSLDLLVNGAGVNPVFGSLVTADLAAVRKIFEVNVTAALAWVQAAWQAWMRAH